MRSLFKLSLAALLAMVVAGTAMAQAQVKWSGNIGTGFGQITYAATKDSNGNGASDAGEDADAYSEYITSIEANIRATVEAGPVTAIARFRPRGHQSSTTGQTLNSGGATNGINEFYAEFWWKATDAFTVGMGRFQGQAWSQPMSGNYLIINPLGAPEYFLNWTGIDGLDLDFNLGAVQVGLGIASECRPACGDNTKSASTMVPHLTGKFGDIGVRVILPQTSGKDGADESHTGAGYNVGVSWSGMQGVYVGFDMQSFTNKEYGGGEDQAKSAMGLRIDFAGLQLGYWSGKTVAVGGIDGADSTETFMKLAYFIKVSDNASLVPEFTTDTTKANDDADAVSKTLIRLVGNVTF